MSDDEDGLTSESDVSCRFPLVLTLAAVRSGGMVTWCAHRDVEVRVSLRSGDRLGPYEVQSLLGAGGMGEVYQARDTKLDRDVAIKVLPDPLAGDAERLVRFEREAKVLASLNHPNIAQIYGLEEADPSAGSGHSGVKALVLELVEGPTLAERIARAPIPLDEALRIATQITEALDAAHERGIVHRDLKPANIKVRDDGTVKVLDFGLAKVPALLAPSDTASTTPAGPTVDGQILGTPAYMSPEQVRGQPASHRSDIWAFGCVLFELLSGLRPFRGDTVTDTLARVLEREPDWKALPAATPPQAVNLLRRCLQKNPAQRLDSIAVARTVIADLPRRGWRPTRRHFVAAAALGLLLLAAFAAYRAIADRESPAASLAVLPLVNVGGDPDMEYLSQGLSESLITDLSRAPGLKVVSRNSAFRYAGPDVDPRAVGRELGVGRILTGRLRQHDETLSVGVELLDTSDGTVVWSEQWERPASALLQVEQDIARQLRLQLSVANEPSVPEPTGNTEAFRLYLRGRYFWNTRTEENLRRSAESFQQAIDSDPGYSLAWSGLADAFLMMGAWSVLEPRDAFPRAQAAAERAIALDSSLAEPHATLGYLNTLYLRDWPRAEDEFRRAIELHPNYATAHHWYAFYRQTIGDIDGSLAEIERASEIDPLSPVINGELSYFYSYARHYDRALLEAQKMVALEPASTYAQLTLAHAYALLQRHGEAAGELETLMAGPRPGVVILGRVAVVYALIGERDKAQVLMRDVLEESRRRYVYPALIAQGYAALGDRDRAFEYFERSIADRSLVSSWLRAPELDSIRSDPRFAALFARLGLKP